MTEKLNKISILILISLFSFFINYHYGFQGINPVDNFTNYNSGFNYLMNKYPFKDYWTATGPFLGWIQSIFFKIFGISWNAYVIHASFFNVIISLSLLIFFHNLGINLNLSFLYSIFFSIIFYPPVGTPFVDHHSMIFTYLSFFLIIYSINQNRYYLFFLLPVLFFFGFFSKQTPIAHFFLIISPIIIYNLRKISIFGYILFGFLLTLFLFSLYIFFTQTSLIDIYYQYFVAASEVGSFRLKNNSFTLYDVFHRYRFIYLSLFFLIYLVATDKNYFNKFKISKLQFIYLLLSLNFTMVFHQLLSMNQAFILSLIFLNFGLCFKFIKFDDKKLSNNKMFFFIILLSVFICVYYHLKFNETRRFNDLVYSNNKLNINAGNYFPSLNKLHWYTNYTSDPNYYTDDPKKEIENLKNVYDFLLEEEKIYSLITDFQFLPIELKKYSNSPVKWFHTDVSFPDMKSKTNKSSQIAFKNFIIRQLKVNDVEKIYFVPPNETRSEIILDLIKNDCIVTDITSTKNQYEEISINCL